MGGGCQEGRAWQKKKGCEKEKKGCRTRRDGLRMALDLLRPFPRMLTRLFRPPAAVLLHNPRRGYQREVTESARACSYFLS